MAIPLAHQKTISAFPQKWEPACDHRHISHRARRALVGIAVLISLAACNAFAPFATPTPVPTPSLPTPRPSLTPRATATDAPSVSLPTIREPDATVTPQVYLIQSGDTLIPIANKYSVSVADLLAANPGLDSTRLQIGQRVVIPAAGMALAQQPARALLPSPTPANFQIRGLNVYRTAAGSLEALGEVFNPGPNALGNVQLQIVLQDAAGKALQANNFFVALDVVPPNSTSPFRVLFATPPELFEKYIVRALRGEIVDPSARFARVNITRREAATIEGSQYRVSGDLRNVDLVSAKRVSVIVTTYDKDKRVIGFRYVDVGSGPLAQNATLPFSATLLSAGTVSDYAISVEGLK